MAKALDFVRILGMPVLLIAFLLCSLTSVAATPPPLRLTLSEALAKAQTLSVDVLAADARVSQAIARLSQTRADLLPHLRASASEFRQTRDLRASGIQFPGMENHLGPFNAFDARLQLTQTIFDPSVFERFAAAKAGEQLSKAQLQKARQDVLALIATMYIQAQRAGEHRSFVEVLVKRDRKAWQLAKTRYEQGTGSLLQLKAARADYAQSRYLYRQAKAQAVQKRLDLAAALKIPLESRIIFDRNYTAIVRKAGQDPGANNSADIQVAAQQLHFQQAQQKGVAAGQWPAVAALADYGRSGKSPGQGSDTYSVGVQARVPIWEGGGRQADVAEAKAKVKEAKTLLEDAKVQNMARILTAQEEAGRARALIAARTAELAAVREQMAVVVERLELGTGHRLDLYKVKAQKAAIEDDRQEAVALLWTAQISLAHARGRMETLCTN